MSLSTEDMLVGASLLSLIDSLDELNENISYRFSRGDKRSCYLLSIQDSSGVEQLKVGTLKTSLTFNSPLTASGKFSGSSVSSASFGRVVATSFHGDGSEMTDTPISSGTVSSSAQFASEISGAFDSGFEFLGTISGSSTTTGSFANLNAADGFNLGML